MSNKQSIYGIYNAKEKYVSEVFLADRETACLKFMYIMKGNYEIILKNWELIILCDLDIKNIEIKNSYGKKPVIMTGIQAKRYNYWQEEIKNGKYNQLKLSFESIEDFTDKCNKGEYKFKKI